jgi:hypothetical protein|tara:strand:- start:1766 stop:1972 length:207 start_codon:yes stop_codon:yes gene_type:complete
MKFKTLKDLEVKYIDTQKKGMYYTFNAIRVEKLRQEAIKWIKFHRKIKEKMNEDDWIDFFNIEESDLE